MTEFIEKLPAALKRVLPVILFPPKLNCKLAEGKDSAI